MLVWVSLACYLCIGQSGPWLGRSWVFLQDTEDKKAGRFPPPLTGQRLKGAMEPVVAPFLPCLSISLSVHQSTCSSIHPSILSFVHLPTHPYLLKTLQYSVHAFTLRGIITKHHTRSSFCSLHTPTTLLSLMSVPVLLSLICNPTIFLRKTL